jgi:uncharacterized delta-60 repeat protein
VKGRATLVVAAALILTGLAPVAVVAAASGDLDPAFGTGGTVHVPPPTNCQEVAQAVRRQSDGKLLVAGVECARRATRDFLVVRLQGDGSLDPTFGTGGRATTDIATTAPPPAPACPRRPCTPPPLVSPADDTASDIVVAPDGNIVAGGWTTGQSGNDFALVRYRPDGTLDSTFGRNGTVTTSLTKGNDSIVGVYLRPDGKIVAVGRSDEFNPQADHAGLAQYLPDGTLDPTFGTGGIATNPGILPYGSAMDPDGNVIVVGVARFATPWDFVVVRYRPDGSLDPGFGTGGVVTTDLGGADDFPHAVAVQPDGNIVVAGAAGGGFALARYRPDGTLDPSFGTGGSVRSGPHGGGAGELAVQPDGRIVVGGTAWLPNAGAMALARYLPDGRLDATFGQSGIVTNPAGDTLGGVVLQPDGKAVAAGGDAQGLVVARYLSPWPVPPPPTTTTTSGSTPGPAPGATGPAPQPSASPRYGYWMVASDGVVYPFGAAHSFGNAAVGSAEAVDLEPTPSGNGYWIVDDQGRVSAFGDAVFRGNVDRAKLAPGEKVASLSATAGGNGYWIFTSRGRALTFGDAAFYGDVSNLHLAGPVLDSIPTTSGHGYYMVGSDGGIFALGDATFDGSMGATRLNAPVQSLVPDGDGVGYWLVASDGGIFAFAADFKGSMGAARLNKPITGMVRAGSGYLMVGEDGGIFDFSGTSGGFQGSLGAHPPARPIVSVAVLDRR